MVNNYQLEKKVSGKANAKTVITIHNARHISKLVRLIRKLKEDDLSYVTVCLNTLIVPRLNKYGIPFKNIEDYVALSDLQDLSAEAIKLSRCWYKIQNRDLTPFQGISLGEILQWKMIYYFAGIFLCIEHLEALYKAENPESIIMLEDREGEVKSILAGGNEFWYGKVAKGILPKEKLKFIYPRSFNLLQDIVTALGGPKEIKIPYINLTLAVPRVFANFLKSTRNIFNRSIYKLFSFLFIKRRISNKQNNIFIAPQFCGTPLEKELLEAGFRVFILETTPSLKDLNNFNKRHIFLSKFKKKISRRNREYRDLLKELADGRLIGNFIYKGKNIWNIAEGRINYIFCQVFEYLTQIVSSISKMLEAEKISHILTFENDTELQQALILVAKKLNIPSLFVQPGNIGHPISWTPFYADEAAVFGEAFADLLVNKAGVSRDRIFITGPFNFDGLRDYGEKGDKKFYDRFNLDTSKKLILLALERYSRMSHFPGFHLSLKLQIEYITEVMEVLKNFPQCQLLVKFHPSDQNFEFVKNSILSRANGPNNVIFTIRADHNQLLNYADLLITRISTIGLKALAMRKKIISLNFEKANRYDLLENSGLIFEARDRDELFRAIKSAVEEGNDFYTLSEAQRNLTINKFIYSNGKNPSQKIAEHIKSVLDLKSQIA